MNVNTRMAVVRLFFNNRLLNLDFFSGVITFPRSLFSLSNFQYLDRPGVTYCSRTTYEDNAITNAIEIYDSPRLTLFIQSLYKSFHLTCSIVSYKELIVYFCLLSVEQCNSWLQTMIVESGTSIWRDFRSPNSLPFRGL